ncbi:hypothetical protein [Flavobacterium sp.]|uniref:hypothetical protein n=1 Tax=Flavobacterium sp. TaxID=239 RepID=UPI002B4B11A8|nr:hypothetical protein [Flavobacterium sp.]HLF53232.1 hypothetical protein [Flavobacterium sp.]
MKVFNRFKSVDSKINHPKNNTEIQETPEFINDFGAIFKEEMIINEYHRKTPIKLKQVTKISFVKRRKYHWNMACFAFSIILVYIIVYHDNYFRFNIVLGLLSLLLVIVGFYFNAFQYKFLLVNKVSFIEIVVNKHLKSDVEEIVIHLNKHIKTL